ncbi:MAG: ribosome biogenesis GTPase YlqF [Clostridiaceae bacterium]|jgi:ribosome biogenesis GTPase A|nr:ribosome biogenesis GTPase YlqF [Clostridiaceae bacterium]
MTKGRDRKQIHWFPGHMASATRELKNVWKHIDAVLEVADARIPVASRNPIYMTLTPQKPYLLLLSHADLADREANDRWMEYFLEEKVPVIACDLRADADIRLIRRRLLNIHRPLLEKAKQQGRIARALRVLVVGIPNTGKSTVINKLVGKKSAIVESRPGVTRSLNWLRSGTELHLLDTPGILPPKLADQDEALGLAATGAIRDTILPLEEVARKLLVRLRRDYSDETVARYGEADGDEASDFDSCAVRMGCILGEGVPDTARFSSMLLDDFRAGRIGRITLEWPPSSDSMECPDDAEGTSD